METVRVALIRAYGDEPRKLRVHLGGGEVKVFGDTSGESIPYPSAFIYEFEDDLFTDLADAYGRGDNFKLTSLWRRARPMTH